MPFYDYACDDCGPFTRLRPMAEAAAPCDCPDCLSPSRRVMRTAPAVALMDGGRRKAFATNEKSASSPKVASKGHGSGCGCCQSPSAASSTPQAAKGFPSKRPWMISH
ncbi:MAG: zinc ribbon domain-containing protein [Rhizobiaceae bacterium]|nr:zinc ribbon domain-containing protein [Rhizobiaceae bacterium]